MVNSFKLDFSLIYFFPGIFNFFLQLYHLVLKLVLPLLQKTKLTFSGLLLQLIIYLRNLSSQIFIFLNLLVVILFKVFYLCLQILDFLFLKNCLLLDIFTTFFLHYVFKSFLQRSNCILLLFKILLLSLKNCQFFPKFKNILIIFSRFTFTV
jgi:hypothetical protein